MGKRCVAPFSVRRHFCDSFVVVDPLSHIKVAKGDRRAAWVLPLLSLFIFDDAQEY